MKKKGEFLAEETLKMVLALIVIGFLIYFLTSLYMSNKHSEDEEFAISTLDAFYDSVEKGVPVFEIYNPEGWYLISWPTEYEKYLGLVTETGIPKSCSNLGWTSCICMCSGFNPDDCDDDGYCLNNDKGISILGGAIEIEEVPLTMSLVPNAGKVEVSE